MPRHNKGRELAAHGKESRELAKKLVEAVPVFHLLNPDKPRTMEAVAKDIGVSMKAVRGWLRKRGPDERPLYMQEKSMDKLALWLDMLGQEHAEWLEAHGRRPSRAPGLPTRNAVPVASVARKPAPEPEPEAALEERETDEWATEEAVILGAEIEELRAFRDAVQERAAARRARLGALVYFMTGVAVGMAIVGLAARLAQMAL